MRLTNEHEDRKSSRGLHELTKRLEAINLALEDFCAATRRLERSRRARASTYRAWLDAGADGASRVGSRALSTKDRS
jgi:hypothetical protein